MKLFRYIVILFLTCIFALNLRAQDSVTEKEGKAVIEAVTADYKNWNKAAWSGKLSLDILPVSATVKVYMEKGKLTLISVRAPFLGEVARIEADKENILLVNKIKKRYYKRSLKDISEKAPDFVEDLQSLLLGRMFLIGCGQLNKKDIKKVNIFPGQGEGCYMFVPETPDYLHETLYGFATDSENRMSTFVCAYGREKSDNPDSIDPDMQYEPKMQAQAEITYPGSGAIAQLQAFIKGKNYSGSLNVDEIEWGGKGFDRINTDGLKSVSLREVLRFK